MPSTRPAATHGPLLWHEADDADGLLPTRADAHANVLRLGWRQQRELGAATLHLQLHTRRAAVSVLAARTKLVRARAGQQHAAAAVFYGDEHRLLQRLAVAAKQAHVQLHWRLAVCRHSVAVNLDQHAADGAVGCVVDAGLFAAKHGGRLGVLLRRQRNQARFACGG